MMRVWPVYSGEVRWDKHKCLMWLDISRKNETLASNDSRNVSSFDELCSFCPSQQEAVSEFWANSLLGLCKTKPYFEGVLGSAHWLPDAPSMAMTTQRLHIFPNSLLPGDKRHLPFAENADALNSVRAFFVFPYSNISIKWQNYLPTFITEFHNLILAFIQMNIFIKNSLMFMYHSLASTLVN